MKAGQKYVLDKAYRAESAVIEHLEAITDRHRAEHEVRHVSIDLLQFSRTNRERLAAAAEQRGARLGSEDEYREHRRATSDDPTIETVTPLDLLEDLRELFLRASAVSLDWEMLAQHAQALHDTELLKLASQCHPRTLQQIAWANTMLKTSSPQALASAG